MSFKGLRLAIRGACAGLVFGALAVSPSAASSATVAVGKAVTLSSAVGSGTAPFNYQWYKDGSPIAGATAATYRIAAIALTDAGTYVVNVANNVGSVASDSAVLVVSAPATPPSITAQPTAQAVTLGQSVTFSVGATGSGSLTYQWYRNGAAIGGASGSSYVIAAAAATDAGNYTVVVSNSAGSVTSAVAALTVNAASAAPTITTQPLSQAAALGSPVSFSVSASGSGTLAYQWQKNGVSISGATAATLSFASVTMADAGNYRVVVQNAVGSTTSNVATLTVSASAVAPTITTAPASQSVTAGQAVTFNVSATGTAPFTYQWRKNGASISGATAASLSLSSVSTSDAGTYSVTVSNTAGSTTSEAAILVVTSPNTSGSGDVSASSAGKLVNISTRSRVGTGGDVMIAGFIVMGTSPKTIYLRASGPALAKFGLGDLLADPVMELFKGSGESLGTNDNWGDSSSQKALILQAQQQLNAFAWDEGSKDAAMVMTLPPGGYTAIISGKNGTSGVALVEAYEVDATNTTARISNISTRSLVLTDQNVQIAGFIISGSKAKRVVIRASGPALKQYGATGVLEDPVLDIHDGTSVIASNDNWDAALRADFQKLGVDNWATGSADAALVLTLNPGGYTAIVSGKSKATGIALIEVFEEE